MIIWGCRACNLDLSSLQQLLALMLNYDFIYISLTCFSLPVSSPSLVICVCLPFNHINFFKLQYRFEKRVRYATRKARADVRKRVKGRFVKAGEAFDYDPLSETRSF